MKSKIKVFVFIVVLLCSIKAKAQADGIENMIQQNIKDALLKGDSIRARRGYNVWKDYTNKTDSILEVFIKVSNNSLSPAFKCRVLIHLAMNSNPTSTLSDAKYKGEKKNGNRDGLGAYYWHSEDFYFGKWEGGYRTGYGIYIRTDGSAYVGDFSKSQMSGKGTYYDKTGKLIYYGEYKDGKPVEIYPSVGNYGKYEFKVVIYGKDIYVGEFENSKIQGVGIYLWNNGSIWYGSWKENKRDGYGIEILNNGTIRKGTWNDNVYSTPFLVPLEAQVKSNLSFD